VAQCSPEELPSSAAGSTADGEDLGGVFEECAQRGHSVAGEVVEFGVAEHVAQHRLGALVVGVELVKGSLEVDDLALVIGDWSFNGTGPDGEPVPLAARNADVLRRQTDGTWRFVIDNPWRTD
jgi:hypothetical protein